MKNPNKIETGYMSYFELGGNIEWSNSRNESI